MIKILQKLDNQSKFSLFTSSFVFAVLVLSIFNLLDAVMYMLLLIQEPSYESVSLSFGDGYYFINDKKMGFSVFYNILFVLFVWVFMVFYNLKSINKTVGWNSFFNINFFRQLE
jgi:hypothetical protein